MDEIAREHGPMIARIAASYEFNAALAQELVQDILVAIWRALPSFRGESSLRTFAARIAGNRASSHALKRAQGPALVALTNELPSDTMTPEAAALAGDRLTRLLAAVRRLPLAYRQPVLLTLEGFKPAEIAELMGLNANIIAIRLTRAKDTLRKYLGENI
jgi:RNA polymerase sigma factor (sigma-70 family)